MLRTLRRHFFFRTNDHGALHNLLDGGSDHGRLLHEALIDGDDITVAVDVDRADVTVAPNFVLAFVLTLEKSSKEARFLFLTSG